MNSKKYGFIYITTNNISGKQYIGQKKYINGWEDYLGSGLALNNAIQKYGAENFSRLILEECDSREELNQRDIFWINYYNAVNSKDFYNIAYGGDGGNTTSNYTKEEKFEIYQKANAGKNKGSKNAFAKKVICLNTMEVFDTIEDAGRKYNISPTKISGCCKKKKHYYSAGTHSETNERLTWEFYQEGEEYTYTSYIRTYKYKKVKCLNTNEIFNSAREASLKFNVQEAGIRKCCGGFLKTSGKHTITQERLRWEYVAF